MSGIVVVGASWGGIHALRVLLSGLPPDFPEPLVVVLHRRGGNDSALAPLLQQHCPLPVLEVEDRMAIAGGHVYLAPADYHLLIDGDRLALSTEAPVHYTRPSVSVLFESAAEACGQGATGVILTGTGSDGAEGLARIVERGGTAVVQDPATAEKAAMPEAALAATPGAMVLPLEQIAEFLAQLCGVRRPQPPLSRDAF